MRALVLFLTLNVTTARAVSLQHCQGDLFSKGSHQASESKPRKPLVDLVIMQKRLWELRAQGKIHEYTALRDQIENQLMLTKQKEVIAYRNEHYVYKTTPMSYAIFREKRAGQMEVLTYELNEELGGPMKIPVTVSQLDGSLQLWMGYEVAENSEILSDKQRDELKRMIAGDADLFLFRFLTVNSDQHPYNLIMDRDAGMVIYDFDLAYDLSLKIFIYSVLDTEAEVFRRPKPVFGGNLTYAKLEEILKEKLKTAKFDWRSALNRMDTERIVDLTAFRLKNRMLAGALRARICILQTLLNGGDISRCSAL